MSSIALISGSSHEKLSNEISNYLGIPLISCTKNQFANTECNFKINENIRNKNVFIIQTGTFNKEKQLSINDFLIETILMINACRYSSCGKITLVMPFYPYCRGDKKDEPRTPISSRAIADILNVDRMVTMDLHSAQQQGFFGNSFKPIPVDNIYSFRLINEYFKKNIFKNMTNKEKNDKFVIVSPDEGAIKRTLKFAGFLQLQNYEFCHKQRIFDKPGIVDDMKLLNICNLKDKTAIICDDIVDSGGTLMKCINLLIKNGVKEVYCIITHAIFTKDAIDKINKNIFIKEFIVTNSLPQEKHILKCPKLKVISVGGLLGEVIKRLINGKSISKMHCFQKSIHLRETSGTKQNVEHNYVLLLIAFLIQPFSNQLILLSVEILRMWDP